jgi:hypothetical protein
MTSKYKVIVFFLQVIIHDKNRYSHVVMVENNDLYYRCDIKKRVQNNSTREGQYSVKHE